MAILFRPQAFPSVRGMFLPGGINRWKTSKKTNHHRFIFPKVFNGPIFDYDGTLLKSETVEYGTSASAPAVEDREGYTLSVGTLIYQCY